MKNLSLPDLGWSDHFRSQHDGTGEPARVSAVARDRLEALSPAGVVTLTLPGGQSTGDYAVGDWLLYEPNVLRVVALLDRATQIRRRAAGREARAQMIAANVDTLGIVSSCNDDFNVARLERYLALSEASGCLPLVILTKADETTTPETFRRQAERLSPLVTALTINAHDPDDIDRLSPWCGSGQTLALVGSSGVGKTTISNALTGREDATRDIREDDSKGRHTTTTRSLRPTLAGGWLIDTPGMRELQLTDAAEGIDRVFADVADLAAQCRFSDCNHESEPGCAVQAAIAAGDMTADRLARWQKLQREDARNSENIAEAHARDRARSKLYAQGRARSRHKRGQ